MLATLLAGLLAAAPPCHPPPLRSALPFRPGEILDLELSIMGLARVGELKLTVERLATGGRLQPFTAQVRSTARLGAVRRLAAVGKSWVDPRSFRLDRYLETADEDGRRRVSDLRATAPAGTFELVQQDGARRTLTRLERRGELLDALSALYLFRAARLPPSARFCVELLGNGRTWRVEGTVSERPEEIEVPAGTFKSWRLEGTARPVDGAGEPRQLWLWISDDARRLPLAVVSEIEAGPVSAKLVEVRPGPAR